MSLRKSGWAGRPGPSPSLGERDPTLPPLRSTKEIRLVFQLYPWRGGHRFFPELYHMAYNEGQRPWQNERKSLFSLLVEVKRSSASERGASLLPVV